MKKLTILLILSVVCFGCRKQVEQTVQTTYKDGTYLSDASGYGGKFQVEVIIENDMIKDVVVKEHNETPSIGGVAIEQMIKKMKDENRYEVDTISGATISSQALKDAVSLSLTQAKNKVE